MRILLPEVRRTLTAIGKVAISCALLLVISVKIDFGAVLAQWRSLDLLTSVVCLAALLTELSILASLRLKFVLAVLGIQRPLRNLLQVVMSGFFFEQIAFGVLGGDTARFLQLRRFDISDKQALAAIVTDRVLGMLGLVTLALLGLTGLFRLVSSLGRHVIIFGSVAVLIGAVIVAAICFTPISRRLRRDVASQLTYLRASLRGDSKLRIRIYSAIGLAILTHLLNILVFALIGYEFHLNLSLLDWLFIAPPVLLVSMMPISAGGWGLRVSGISTCETDRTS